MLKQQNPLNSDTTEITQTLQRSVPLLVDDVYKAHWRDLCGGVRKVFGSGPPEPEDLVQEAFTKFAAIKNKDDIKHPRAFIYKIAVNLGFNASKRLQTARRFIDTALLEVGECLVEENSPEDVYSYEQRMKLTSKTLAVLPAKQREIVIRSRIHGQTYAVISAETGWSSADISRQMTAALKTLQRELLEP